MTGRRLQGKIAGLLCSGATYSVQLSSRATKPSGVAITRQFDTGSRVEHYPKLLGRSAGGGGCAKIRWIFVSRSPQHVGYIVYKYWAGDWRCLQKYKQRISRARKRLLLPQSQGSYVAGKLGARTLDGYKYGYALPSTSLASIPAEGRRHLRRGDSPPRVRESTSHKVPKAAASFLPSSALTIWAAGWRTPSPLMASSHSWAEHGMRSGVRSEV
jgi:hypothetical protein